MDGDESGMELGMDVDAEYELSFLLTAPQDGGGAGREEVEVVMEVEWVSSGDGRRVAVRSSCLVEVCDAIEVREEVRYRCKCWEASAVVSLLLQWTPASILGQVLQLFSRALESQSHHVVAGLLDLVRELVRECGLDGLSPWSLGLSERLY